MRSIFFSAQQTNSHGILQPNHLHAKLKGNDVQHLANVWSAQPRPDVDSSHLHRNQRKSLGEIMHGLKADNNPGRSQAVPHPITDQALRRLTSEVERSLLYLTLYGRQRHQWK